MNHDVETAHDFWVPISEGDRAECSRDLDSSEQVPVYRMRGNPHHNRVNYDGQRQQRHEGKHSVK